MFFLTLIFQVITLNKGDKGLGFSILDYQDPLNMSETVIVVRSLVPWGIAQLDGQIVPGDRILHVNQVRLEHVSLDTAVQALKGKVLSPLEACFDLISGSSLHMKIQIMGGKITEILGSNHRCGRSIFFCPFFFSFINSP